jgi:hypothetical protein
MEHMEIVDMSTEEGRATVEEYDRDKAETVRFGQQLFAKIKRSSKYYNQNEWAEAEPKRWGGFPFKVRVDPTYGEYCIQGGPGGQYRLADVNLFVVEGGRELRIS